MFKEDSRRNKRCHQPYKASGKKFTPAELVQLFHKHPELRLDDNPAHKQLAQMLIADSEDSDLQEMFAFVVDNKHLEFLNSNDVFWGNYPPAGSLVYPPGFLALGDMPNGDPIGLLVNQLTGNVGILGPTKSGKTTLISALLSYHKLLASVRIVAFVKKPELRHLVTIFQLSELISIFRKRKDELSFSLFEPPPSVPVQAWNNEVTRLIGQCYARFSSQRLFGKILNDLTANHPCGVYPTLRQLVEVLDEFKPRFGMREAAYKESILWCLTDLLNCTDEIWDYSSSDFLEHLFSTPGLAIIELEDVPQEHFTLIATYMMRWIYFKRLYASQGGLL